MKSPYFKFYVSDFLQGTRHFSAEEVGAYVLLLCEQWDAGFVENDEEILKKISRISKKKRQKVDKKFQETSPGQLKNNRLEIEREKYIEFSNKQASNGSKGGRRKAETNPTLKPNESQKEPNANPTLKPNESLPLSLSGNTNVLPMSLSKETNVSVTARTPELSIARGDHWPTWQAVQEFFMHQNADPEAALRFFNRFEGLGWMHGITPIRKWQSFANNWIADPFGVEKKIQGATKSGRIVIMEHNGGEVEWSEDQYKQYCNNTVASGYTFVRYAV